MRLLLLGFVMYLAVMGARAAEVPYDAAAFSAAVKAGQPVAVVFHADWCPTCRAQAPVLKQLMEAPERRAQTLYVADFDTEMALRKELKVNQQSTVVVFRKGREITRSTGDTEKQRLAALLDGGAA